VRGYQKVKNYEDMFVRFDSMHERARHPDGRIDAQTPYYGIGRIMRSIARQNCRLLFEKYNIVLQCESKIFFIPLKFSDFSPTAENF